MATGIYELAKKIVLEVIKPVASEGIRLTPDAILYGTGLVSLITYQTPMLFLFLSTPIIPVSGQTYFDTYFGQAVFCSRCC